MRYVFLLLMLNAYVMSVHAQESENPVWVEYVKKRETWNEACKSMWAKDYNNAIAGFNASISSLPFFNEDTLITKGVGYYQISYCYFTMGDTAMGCRYLGEAVKELDTRARWEYGFFCGKNPSTDSAYIIRGISRGIYHLSVADYDTAIMLNPKNAWAYYQRGGQFIEVKKYEAASADFNEVIKLQPDDYHGYYFKGMVNFKQSNYKDAAACFTDAMKRDTTYKKLHLYRGISLYNMKDYKEAINDFVIWEKEIMGKNLGSIYNLHAKCLLELNDKKAGCEYFGKATALGYKVTEDDLEKCK